MLWPPLQVHPNSRYCIGGVSPIISLKRLRGDWYAPGRDDLTLPIPNTNSSRTTLRSLADRVSPRGPRVDPFPELPPGAPYWGGRVKAIPKQDDWDYKQVSEAAANLCKKGQTINIYSVGVFSNERREDGKQIGACSAVLYHQGREWKHTERVLGETVMTNDTAIRSLSPALEVLADFLSSTQVEPQCNTLVFLPSKFAINRALDGSPHDDQAVVIRFLKQLGELRTAHPHANIRLLWLPRSIPFVGFRRAKQLMLEAVRVVVLNPELEPHTTRDQKGEPKRKPSRRGLSDGTNHHAHR